MTKVASNQPDAASQLATHTAPAKKPTVGQLLRKIERLEAHMTELAYARERVIAYNNRLLCDKVDAEIRIKQAVAILTGQEE